MKALTPAERRGAWAVLLLMLLGSAHDFFRGGEETPPRGTTGVAAGAAAAESTADSHPARPTAPTAVDLNRADSLTLEALPGIGPVLTARILAHRRANEPFRAPEELMGVRGVGPSLYGKLKARITVAPAAESGADSGAAVR